VKVAEGLVLAADSVVTLEGSIDTSQGQAMSVIQMFESANKVTRFKDYPIGIMTWGLASIADRSIQSLIMEFEYGYKEMKQNKKYTVKQIADGLLSFIKARYRKAFPNVPDGEGPILGMLIGGYSSGKFFADEYSIEIPFMQEWEIRRPNRPNGSPFFGADWFGQIDALLRLIKGYDPASLDELVNRGVDKKIIEKWAQDGVGELPLVFDGMPLQDAIDFAEYAVQVVIGRWRFGQGPPLCGGEIDIAVITPRGFQWAQRKQWALKD
jgi:hypothetical protein